MDEGVAYNIYIPDETDTAFTHTATITNIVSNWTYIDHPATNNNPHALIYLTQNWNPNNQGGTYNDQPIGVWYDTNVNQWAIFNQDELVAMPIEAAFNVMVIDNRIYIPMLFNN